MGQVLEHMWQAARRCLYRTSLQPGSGGFTQDELLQNLHLRSPERAAELQAVGAAQYRAVMELTTFDQWAHVIQGRGPGLESLRVHAPGRRRRPECPKPLSPTLSAIGE